MPALLAIFTTLFIAGCAWWVTNSESLGGVQTGPRWGEIEYDAGGPARSLRERDAREKMEKFCSPGSYRVTRTFRFGEDIHVRFECVEAAVDPAIQRFVEVQLPAALTAKGRNAKDFNDRMAKIDEGTIPATRQKSLIGLLARATRNGLEILIAIVDSPLEQVHRFGRMEDSAQVRTIEAMDAAFTSGRPLSLAEAMNR